MNKSSKRLGEGNPGQLWDSYGWLTISHVDATLRHNWIILTLPREELSRNPMESGHIPEVTNIAWQQPCLPQEEECSDCENMPLMVLGTERMENLCHRYFPSLSTLVHKQPALPLINACVLNMIKPRLWKSVTAYFIPLPNMGFTDNVNSY